MGRQTNLHAVWDTGIIEQAVKGDERDYAMRLTRNVTQPELSQWSQGDPISWANESHKIARVTDARLTESAARRAY
jgi:S1/P1 Nuclease